MSFGGDKFFLPRLKQIAFDIPNADVETLANSMRATYREYGRKKAIPFLGMVERGMAALGLPQSAEDVVILDEVKAIDARKRKHSDMGKKKEPAIVVPDSDEYDPNSSRYINYEDTNYANNTVANLYVPSSSEKQTKKSSSKTKQKKAESKATTASSLNKPRGLGNVAFEIVPRKSEVSFQQLGGCNRQFLEVCRLAMHMRQPRTFARLGVEPPKGFLVHGPPGCGKSMFAQAIAGEFDLPMLQLAATELTSGVTGETEDKLRKLFDVAKENAPCILILDDIDAIAPRREAVSREMERRVVTQLCNCLDNLFAPKIEKLTDILEFDKNGDVGIKSDTDSKEGWVLVIGTTSRPEALDNGLRRAGRFDSEIALGIPDEDAREKILSTICKLPLQESIRLRQIARLTPGYVGADLNALIAEAAKCAVNRMFDTLVERAPDQRQMTNAQIEEELQKVLIWLKSDDDPLRIATLGGFEVTMADFERAIEIVQPSAKREGFATVPDVTWNDIGALHNVRAELEWNILFPVKRPEDFELLGISTKPQGILLCGPPGCGKTLLAKAVANETGMNFISVKGPELLNMYVGESERAVRTVFSRARDSSPCVIFFDEIDALCPKRSHNETSGSARLVNQLLTEMDGVEARKQVFLIGATNRPDMVDPAILRPGRLDKILFVDFPAAADRCDILKKITKDGTNPRLSPNFDITNFATDVALDGYTGADLSALVHEAGIIALKQRLFDGNSTITAVDESHFREALSKIRPSVSPLDKKKYLRMKQLYATGSAPISEDNG